MRIVMDGPLWLEYGQFFVGGYKDSQDCFAGQQNGLCGAAAAGHLFFRTGLHTGKVGLRVEVHERMPSVEYDAEDVVEASYLPSGDALLSCLGDHGVPLELEPIGYRVRYSAWGMDAGHQSGPPADDESLVDRYLLQLWPARPAPERVVKATSRQAAYWHRATRELPTPDQLAEQRAERARLAEAERIAADTAAWGGTPPSERLRNIRFAQDLCRLDRPLADALERADEPTRRAVARWAARRACVEAEYSEDAQVTAILAAMDRGDDYWPLLHPPVPNPSGKVQLGFQVLHFGWRTDATPLENVEMVVKPTYDEDSLRGVIEAVVWSLGAFGNQPRLLAELRLAFPGLG
ncbi:hypothetical protein [Kribbella sp. NPDC004536]|uniref:hypothetical protein n=1 Tax=Kribbella sp. NPDC004536 TaxID=3364106 RepID=UPI00368C1A01